MKDENAVLKAIPERLLAWYDRCARKLPWRENRDPYRIWISEIMLQQTRVEAVKEYYTRFLAAFPDVFSLAEAPEEQVLKLWEGLGYYSRARNLQKAAQGGFRARRRSCPSCRESEAIPPERSVPSRLTAGRRRWTGTSSAWLRGFWRAGIMCPGKR